MHRVLVLESDQRIDERLLTVVVLLTDATAHQAIDNELRDTKFNRAVAHDADQVFPVDATQVVVNPAPVVGPLQERINLRSARIRHAASLPRHPLQRDRRWHLHRRDQYLLALCHQSDLDLVQHQRLAVTVDARPQRQLVRPNTEVVCRFRPG